MGRTTNHASFPVRATSKAGSPEAKSRKRARSAAEVVRDDYNSHWLNQSGRIAPSIPVQE